MLEKICSSPLVLVLVPVTALVPVGWMCEGPMEASMLYAIKERICMKTHCYLRLASCRLQNII